jgi:hypothetical protein
MIDDEYVVAIVVDPEVGGRLHDLLTRMPDGGY